LSVGFFLPTSSFRLQVAGFFSNLLDIHPNTKGRRPNDAEKRGPGRARGESVALFNGVKAQRRACNHGQRCQQPTNPKAPSACGQGDASNQGWNEHEFQQEEQLGQKAVL
jgi:hypothetical protein